MADAKPRSPSNDVQLAAQIRAWGAELGFQHVGISRIDLGAHPAHLLHWLERGFHGDMGYMARNVAKRSRPEQLIPGTLSILSARMNYLPDAAPAQSVLESPDLGYIARYALGRDYHKLMRRRLARLTERLRDELEGHSFVSRPFSDSAPVLEKAIGEQAGAGWIGKNTLLIHPTEGSWFLLGEIYTDLALEPDGERSENRCGSCRACLTRCPTGAFHAPYELDARRCISYLTIEQKGVIPVAIRPLMGNRIFGCDDCQLVCPWNREQRRSTEADFAPRHALDAPKLVELFSLSEAEYLKKSTGSPLRRPGYHGWIRNVAVALGNAPGDRRILDLLESRRGQFPDWVAEHIEWAIEQQRARIVAKELPSSSRS